MSNDLGMEGFVNFLTNFFKISPNINDIRLRGKPALSMINDVSAESLVKFLS